MSERPTPASVTKQDRTRMARQARALSGAESDDEGAQGWRAAVFEEANRFRSRQGISELKTESELHRYARALGLIRS